MLDIAAVWVYGGGGGGGRVFLELLNNLSFSYDIGQIYIKPMYSFYSISCIST